MLFLFLLFSIRTLCWSYRATVDSWWLWFHTSAINQLLHFISVFLWFQLRIIISFPIKVTFVYYFDLASWNSFRVPVIFFGNLLIGIAQFRRLIRASNWWRIRGLVNIREWFLGIYFVMRIISHVVLTKLFHDVHWCAISSLISALLCTLE